MGPAPMGQRARAGRTQPRGAVTSARGRRARPGRSRHVLPGGGSRTGSGDAPARGRESPWREDAMAGEPGRTVEGLHGPGEGDRETITQVAASARNEA